MNKLLLVLFSFVTFSAVAQDNPTTQAKPIVEEGKRLYKSEMASWYGTDIFVEKYPNRENIGGYFSYMDGDVAKCIFFSKASAPKVIGTISFDSTYNTQTAKADIAERDFTATEKDLYAIRQTALGLIGTDSLFKVYKNSSLNLIPIINGGEKKVYVLTGPKENGIIIFGNDYLLTFNNDNNVVSKKQLHKNIIQMNYGEAGQKLEKVEGSMHTHLPETGDFITATDICTLMLYEKFAKWKSYNVVSKNYLNIWNCETDQLTVLPMSTIKKINDDQGKRNKQKD